MKALNNFLFVASFFCMSALVIALSGCSRQEHKDPPPARAQIPAEVKKPEPIKNDLVSVDFDNAPLSEVAQFVTTQTGKGFVVNADKPLSWIEYKIRREKVLDSFDHTLTAAGLVMKPTTNDKTVFTIDKAEDIKVPYKLDFASSSRGTFFLLGQSGWRPLVRHAAEEHGGLSPRSLGEMIGRHTRPRRGGRKAALPLLLFCAAGSTGSRKRKTGEACPTA